MKRFVILTWLLATFFSSDLFSQSREDNRNTFYDAESWILFESYQDALPLYLQLLKNFPDNSNYKYRIGQCYINIPGDKSKAIRYLEDAVKHINPGYKEGKFSETGAPYDALYYLANAYRINNQLDKALTTYIEFRKNLNPAVYDSTIVDLQIQSCRTAGELMNMTQYVKLKNMGNSINGSNNDFNPVVSEKEDLIVFSKSLAFYDAILYSTKKNGVWSNPVNMNEMLKVDRDLFPTSLSKDGKDLYLYSSADYDGIIYTSRFENGTWSPLIKLNDNINTKYWESHATISHDNNRLYFTSNRKGSLGGLDIYVSARDSSGNWGPAVNLGPVINTPYNEESPFLSDDDKTLYFSSRGHMNMGGYDIFYSKLLENGSWSTPVNIGYPLNTTDDDVFFNPLNNGFEGYTSKEIKGGFGRQDIYRIEIFSDDHPRKFYVMGTAKVADLINNLNDSIKVSVENINNPGKEIVVYSDPRTGKYNLILPQGDYRLSYEGKGAQRVDQRLVLALMNPSDSITVPETTLQRIILAADTSKAIDKTVSTENTTKAKIPVKKTKTDATVVRSAVKPRAVPQKTAASYAEMLKAKEDSDMLKVIDPAIAIIRDKVTVYGKYADKENKVSQAVSEVDHANFQKSGPWLEAFCNNALKQGFTEKQLAEMLSVLSSLPGTRPDTYKNDLLAHSEEPFTGTLKVLDLKNSGVGTPEELIIYLRAKKDLYPDTYLFSSLANLIASKNVSDDIILAHFKVKKSSSSIILPAIGLALLLLLLLLWRRRKDDKKNK